MENFDELMRQKYDNDDPAGRFEFREEYWEQARALIEADEARRRKRRRLLFWWFFAGLMLFGAGLGWWNFKPHSTLGDAVKRDRLENPAGSTGVTESQNAHSDTADRTGATEKPDRAEATKDRPLEGTQRSDFEKNIDNQKIKSKNKDLNPALKAASDNPAIKNDRHRNPETHRRQGALSYIQQKGSETGPDGIRPLGLRSDGKTSDGSSAEAPAAQRPERSDAADKPEPSAAVGHENSLVTKDAETSPSRQSDGKMPESVLELPLPFPAAQHPGHQLPPKPVNPPLPMTAPIKPVKDKNTTFHISVAAMAYKATQDLRWLGFSGALSAKYLLRDQWSVSLGLGMRYQPGSWRDSVGTDIVKKLHYSFGFESITSERSALGLLYLELPMSASWKKGIFELEAGMAPGRLLYALERFKQSEESSFEGPKALRNRLERGDTAPYGKYYFNTFAGAAYRFSRYASITLRGNYRFGAIVKAVSKDQPAVFRAPGLELGLNVTLF